jgi:hypothetical protein
LNVIEKSDSIKELAAAMAKAQGAVKGALKDSKNPHFKNNYADLASVWEACREALADNGLAVMQFPTDCEGGRINVVQLVTHASGEWIQSTVSIPLAKVDAQSYGSATTYARRYALAAAVGVAPEDDDGNAAVNGNGADNSARQKPIAAQTIPNASQPAMIDDAQATKIQMICKALGGNTLADMIAAYASKHPHIRTINDFTAKQADQAIDRLNQRLAERAAEETNKNLGDALGDSLPELGGAA